MTNSKLRGKWPPSYNRSSSQSQSSPRFWRAKLTRKRKKRNSFALALLYFSQAADLLISRSPWPQLRSNWPKCLQRLIWGPASQTRCWWSQTSKFWSTWKLCPTTLSTSAWSQAKTLHSLCGLIYLWTRQVNSHNWQPRHFTVKNPRT